MAQDHAAAKRGGPQDGPLSGRQTGSQSDAGHGAAPDGPDVPGPAADNLPADNVPATDLPATDPPANDLPIESSIPVMLLRARERLMRDFRPLLAAEGFTEQQWRVMRTLAARGPLDAAALSDRSLILPPSLPLFLAFVLWQTSVFFQVGMTLGNLNALAMEPLGHMAGTAASVMGAIATVLGTMIAVPIGLAFDGTPLPLAIGIGISSVVGYALMLKMRRLEQLAA